VLVFHNAGTAAGNIAPSRTISLATDQKYIQLDTQRDVLYISTRGGDILAVQGASAANSSVTPPTFRTLNLGIAGIVGIALDPTKDVLYIAGSGSIGTIRAVSTKQTGAVTLDDQWSVSSPESFSVDPTQDRLFVSSLGQGNILVYDNASTRTTATGTVSRTFTLPSGFSAYTAIFLEPSADRLYAVGQNKIFIASSVGSANGPQSATLIQLSTMNSGLTAIVTRP
jgi:DNA-binding beta-propeller fold protein YncE